MYGKSPKVLGRITIPFNEYMYYQYLPIKLANTYTIKLEERLSQINYIISNCVDDYIMDYSKQSYLKSYIYLTVKHQYQRASFNREGWHSDGFLSDDINYIWCNSQPTEFAIQEFNLSNDDKQSIIDMENQVKPENIITYPVNHILRLDQYVIHRVGSLVEGLRSFVKITFSPYKYNLIGNSHNYELDYDWKMHPRNKERNIPYRL